jgi:Tfp pilus assembly protein PilF
MMRIPWLCTVAILFCLSDPHSFSQTSDPQTELQLGIAAYEKAAYKEAVDHLKRAVLLDPSLTIAHLYLANTYSDLYCTTCEFDSDAGDTNEQRRVLVLEEYNKVLELDSSNTKALNSMANLHYRRRSIHLLSLNGIAVTFCGWKSEPNSSSAQDNR